MKKIKNVFAYVIQMCYICILKYNTYEFSISKETDFFSSK